MFNIFVNINFQINLNIIVYCEHSDVISYKNGIKSPFTLNRDRDDIFTIFYWEK